MKKTAIAVAVGVAATISAMSLIGAGDEEVVSTLGPTGAVATPTADATAEPSATAVPADVPADMPADVEPPVSEQPAPMPAPEDLPWGPPYQEAAPWVPGAPINGEIREPYEDEPGFDCRIHGNHKCGVSIQGAPYVVTFDQAGQPTGAYQR